MNGALIRLTREVRLNVALNTRADVCRGMNRWAGEPVVHDPAAHLRLRLTVVGVPDGRTGYLADIRALEERVRAALPSERFAFEPSARLIRAVWAGIRDLPKPARKSRLELWINPHLYWAIREEFEPMVSLTQSFEFSAAHRLHCDSMSDEDNRAVFGKCNNPRGHGHNYIVDVTVSGEPERTTGLLLPAGDLEAIVRHEVIDRFDHRHLNEDCAEFWSLNPTVENIARVIFERLSPRFESVRLTNVRVWETPKTYADCGVSG